MSIRKIKVPMQPYAGKRLIIEKLLLPMHGEIKSFVSAQMSGDLDIPIIVVTKPKPRPSYFERPVIYKQMLKYSAAEGLPEEVSDELVEAILAALETYMKYIVQSVIELCEHRASYHLYSDDRWEIKHDMRTSMMFLNDLEMADYGSSDEETAYCRRRRWLSSVRQRRNVGSIRMESANTTAMMALGSRKRAASEGSNSQQPTHMALGMGPSGSTPVVMPPAVASAANPRPFSVRCKRVSIKDVLQFMEEEKRYTKSNMLFEAYLKYKC